MNQLTRLISEIYLTYTTRHNTKSNVELTILYFLVVWQEKSKQVPPQTLNPVKFAHPAGHITLKQI